MKIESDKCLTACPDDAVVSSDVIALDGVLAVSPGTDDVVDSGDDVCTDEFIALDMTILTKNELSKKLGVSVSTIYRWAKQGILPAPIRHESGNNAGWLKQTINDWIAKSQ
ncbi:MerR family DNA-binding transcriptional regulator (plasmid) [Moritella sp. 24]|uniref:helix-turn-helix transcriptional regulator n=1 Tax=Moritella sp. 24 TaxID=2746230 RepID=UPI001BACC21E|nr:MerR family DNA-binding transcriptional regulator [Moritella sp. 24]QUM78743.1 MerR family DNA-binding transcriptional regulator [Moritella sp. 24]